MTTVGHWTVVREVISSTNTGAQVMGALPGLVRRLLDEDAWREFATPDGKTQRYEHFTEFVEAPPPRGLGGRVSQLVALCGTDETLAERVRRLSLDDIDAAAANGTNQHTEGFRGTKPLPGSDTVERTVARLKRDAPELAERVASGEMSAYAVNRQTGKRPPRIELRSPQKVAAQLRKHMTPEQVAELRDLLTD